MANVTTSNSDKDKDKDKDTSTKPRATDRPGTNANNAFMSNFGFNKFANDGLVELSRYEGSYVVLSFVEDKLAGLSFTDEIWSGDRVNSNFISMLLASEATKKALVEFFASRAIAKVVTKLLEFSQWQVGGYQALVADVVDAVRSVTPQQDAATVDIIVEIILPGLVKNQIVHKHSRPIMRRGTYPFVRTPEIGALTLEVARSEIERAVATCTGEWSVNEKQRYSVRALSQVVADAYFKMARALREAFDFATIFADMVRAVRVRLDPECSGLNGELVKSIAEHRVVDTLMYNWTFIQAALALPEGYIMTAETETYKFDKWADAALAILVSSDRYAFRGRDDVLSNLGLTHFDDLVGFRRSAIIYEHAKMEPVALSVMAVADMTLDGALNIDRSTGRIESHIAAAYGSVCETMSIQKSCASLGIMLASALELDASWSGVFNAQVRRFQLQDVAVMLSTRILFDRRNPADIVYECATDAMLELTSGICVRNNVFTTDPLEVLLAAPSREPSSASAALPQLLPKSALGSQLFLAPGVDAFIKLDRRFAFNQQVGSVTIRGSLRLNEFETARSDFDARLVVPEYNRAVYETVRGVFFMMRDIVQKTEEPMARIMRREYAQHVIYAIRGVSQAFRQSVATMLAHKSMSNLPQNEVRQFGALLNQKPVQGFADIVAAAFFFSLQGIGIRAATYDPASSVEGDMGDDTRTRAPQLDTWLTSMWQDDDMREMMVDFGSDRVK